MTLPVPHGPIFRSGWNPRGARRSWRRIAIAPATAFKALVDLKWDSFSEAEISEAIGWFDRSRDFKMFFVRLVSGDEIMLRNNSRGYAITFTAKRVVKTASKAVPA